ncbi:MAG: hypothetical protein R2839_01095 [Thermomicrobiales bacterium]
MNNLPFDKPGTFRRGNLHTHTTTSDGGKPVEEVVAAYQRQGYDFLSITDHFMERYGFPIVDTTPFRSDAFTTIIGSELHAPALWHGELWHILANGLPLDFAPPAAAESGIDLARRAAEAGAFVTVAHPSWYGVSIEDALSIDVAHAIEIYNHTAHHHNDKGDSSALIDQVLMLARKVNILAVDDAHFSTRPDFFGGWVQVKATSLDQTALLNALKAGHFYSSQGPEIYDISIENGKLTVATSPVHSIFLTGGGPAVERARGERLMSATFPVDRFKGRYCRVTAVDDAGNRAWSNPIWLD